MVYSYICRFYLDESTRESVSRQNSVDVDTIKTSESSHHVQLHITEQNNVNMQQNNDINNTNSLKEPQPSSIVDREGTGLSEQEQSHEQLVQIANELLTDLISDVVGSVCEEQKPNYLECKEITEHTSTIDQNSISLSPLSEDSGICSPQKKCITKGTNSGNQNRDQEKDNSDNNEGLPVNTNKGLYEHSDPDTSHDSIMEGTSNGREKRRSSFFENLSGDVKYWLGVSYRNEGMVIR